MNRRFWCCAAATIALGIGGCGSDGLAPQGKVTQSIGAAGGELRLPGLVVIVPAGALDRTLELSAERMTTGNPAGVVGGAVELGPSGTTFAKPVTVTLNVEPTTVDPLQGEEITLAVVEGGEWEPLADSRHDATAATVTATTTHFSRYGVVKDACGRHRPCHAGLHCVQHHCLPVPEQCDDGKDNDGDGHADCADPDCQKSASCSCESNGTTRCCYPTCGVGTGLVCLGDNICGYPCSCEPVKPPVESDCKDGLDNDNDGAIDCWDKDCLAAHACTCDPSQGSCCYPICDAHEERVCLGRNLCGYPCTCEVAPTPVEDCKDGVDNDKDGDIDCHDKDCIAAHACTCDPAAGGCCYPICGAHEVLECLGANICGYPCTCVPAPPPVEDCKDGVDNDHDGAIDCKDADCHNDPACAVGVCGECVSDQDCRPGSVCNANQICLHSCSCPACAVCAGHCVAPTTTQWYYTCGAPVCQGYTGGSGAPLCTTEAAGDPCNHVGGMCDPKDGCNRLLVCATSDPTQQPGGCPISRREHKQDIRYVDGATVEELRDQVLRMKLATWRYKQSPEAEHLGFIIDDMPGSAAVRPDGEHVDLYGYTSLAVAAIQAQAKEIANLKSELKALKKQLRRR